MTTEFQPPNPVTGSTSPGNSSEVTLGGAATFTGDWVDISSFSAITIACVADEIGTLWADFSTDGSTAIRNVQLSDGLTADMGIHGLVPIAQYFRVRVINGATPQGSLQLQTLLSVNPKIAIPTSRMGQALSDYSDVLNTRAVISDPLGVATARVTDHRALQVIPPPEGRSGFGEAATTQVFPTIQVRFPYPQVDPLQIVEEANQSGSVSAANSLLSVSTGAAANSGAMACTRDRVPYRPGQGTLARFTGVFTAGVTGSEQTVGVGDSSEGYFFGYDEDTFGVLHRREGRRETQELQITTKSSTAENITITLDGDAIATIAVTNGADVTVTANEIAAGDYSDVGMGWTAEAAGDLVIFTSYSSEVMAGAFTLSSATTAIGTFTSVVAGVAPTDDWVPQASWNGFDIFDGNGITGVNLDPTKGNVFQVRFQYLGFGAIQFFIEDPDDGEMHLMHTIEWSNNNTTPSMENPQYPMSIAAMNVANTSDMVCSSASLSAFNEGVYQAIGVRRGVTADVVLAGVSTETPILAFQVKRHIAGRNNRTPVKSLRLAGSVDHTKTCKINFYAAPTLVGANFVDVGPTSGVAVDTSATSFSGGVYLFSMPLGQKGQVIMDLEAEDLNGLYQPGDIVIATLEPSSVNGAEGTFAMYYVELF